MTRIRFFLAAGTTAFLLLGAHASAESRPFRFDELARVRRVSGLALSPDGRWVAFAVATPDVEENRTRSAIWLAPASGGEPRPLTSGSYRDAEPKFSPDGRRLAFLSSREGGSQVWLLDLSGGDPVKATELPTEVNGYAWSPDGKWLVVTSDVFPACSDMACLEKSVRAREKSKTRGRIAERLLYRHWDSWKDGLRTHVWKVAVGGSGASDLTPGDFDAPPFSVGGGSDFDISPDGTEFVFASNHEPVEATSTNADLWLTSFDRSGQARNLTAGNPAWDGAPKFSPDGRWIAYRAQKRPGFEADRFRLMVLDRSSGTGRSLTEAFDQWVEEFAWARDSRAIFFVTHAAGRGAIVRVDLAGGGTVEIWRGGSPGDLRPTPDGKRIVFLSSTLSRAAEVWQVGTDGKGAAPLTRVNDSLFAETELGKVSERFVASSDGRRLQAWLVTPPGFDAGRKYPAVFLIHGGPQGAWGDGWSFRWNPQVWAAYGYVVYAANPRGSTGFGQEFLDQISGDWGGRVYDDLMRQADDLASLPYVDTARIAAAGASYGGYMVNWIEGHTNRFRCIVSHDGTFDTNSANIETEELWFPEWEFKGWPWSSALYEKWNPMRFADKFQTPMLVITSERDYRVPFGQGLQLFTALQLRKVPSKLLMFPDEGHWVLKPGNSRLWHNVVFDWLHRWLGGAEADPKALETAYSVTR
jgi:dipeptidyl aminopeptidase/acylaminoacyl peptidase